MKGGREHRVPLSAPALALLKDIAISRNGFVFRALARSVYAKTMAMALRRQTRDMTVHGFRSTFATGRPSTPAFHARWRRWRSRTRPERGRGGLPARRPVREAPQADGRLGRVLRQGRDGRWQGGRARSCANTAGSNPPRGVAGFAARRRTSHRRPACPTSAPVRQI